MKIGIVVLNYNTLNTTKSLVQACCDMGVFNTVVVVDNNSSEDVLSVSEISDEVVLLKQNENLGYARGNNIGFQYLSKNDFDYAFLANPDVVFTEETIETIVDFLKRNQEYCVVSSKRGDNSYGDDALQFWERPSYSECLLEAFYLFRRVKYKKKRIKSNELIALSNGSYIDVQVVPGAFFGVNLKIFEEIGYLDNNTFLWFEENCLSSRVYKAGYKEAILLNCYYFHEHGSKVHGNKLFYKYNLSKEYYCNQYLNISKIKACLLKIFDTYSNIEQSCLNILGKYIKRRLK